MTWAQIALVVAGGAAFAWSARLCWLLGHRHLSLEVGPVARAVRRAVSAGARDQVLETLDQDSWVSRLVRAGLQAEREGEDPGLAMALVFRDLRAEANDALRTLRLLARACTFGGLLAAIWEYSRPRSEELGLRALVAGAAEEVASGRAMECIAIGLGFGAVALAARGILRGPARSALVEIDKLRERLENLLASPMGGERREGGPRR